MEISGKVVLITGASKGIGWAAAKSFAQAGAKLALVARSADLLADLATELQAQGHEALALPADLMEPEQPKQIVAKTVKHFGRLDILINNAGRAVGGNVADFNPDDFHAIIDLNIFAPLLAMQAAIPVMRQQGGGMIINVSSIVTKAHISGIAAYAATKSALNMISDTARQELAGDNIRVISVLPRVTATDFAQHSLGDPELRQRRRPTPSDTVDTPEYVADKILEAAVKEVEEQYMVEGGW